MFSYSAHMAGSSYYFIVGSSDLVWRDISRWAGELCRP